MNRTLLDILTTKPGFPVHGEDLRILEFFVEYLDHNSLWLLRYEDAEDPVFYFTNEAQRFNFTISQMKKHYANLKSGIPMDWESIPFEYISK